MLKYTIKQDGYPIGVAVGKKKAVERVKHYLAWEGVTKAIWQTKGGVITANTSEGIFTIEKDNN